MGAHAHGANLDSLGVCVTGNFEIEEPTEKQIAKLIYVLAYWCSKYGIDPGEIYGHRDKGTTATLCPGSNLYKYMSGIKNAVNRMNSNSSVILGWPA